MLPRPSRIDRPKYTDHAGGTGRPCGIDRIDRRSRLALLRIGPPDSPEHPLVS